MENIRFNQFKHEYETISPPRFQLPSSFPRFFPQSTPSLVSRQAIKFNKSSKRFHSDSDEEVLINK